MVYTSGRNVLTLPVSNRDHTRGLNLKNVTLVEYGDYQCPYSHQAYSVVESILRDYNNNIRFVYRHFPLTQIHPLAEGASKAAESAALQGKFWDMHEQLYRNSSLDELSLRRYASIIGLNLAQFERDLVSTAVIQRVNEDYQSGVRSGVRGTPSFFINGKLYSGSWDFTNLWRSIAAQMKP